MRIILRKIHAKNRDMIFPAGAGGVEGYHLRGIDRIPGIQAGSQIRPECFIRFVHCSGIQKTIMIIRFIHQFIIAVKTLMHPVRCLASEDYEFIRRA